MPIVAYSNVQGGWPGVMNIDANPLFANQSAGDFRLLPGSPCIDSGDDSAVPPGVVVDLNGNSRFVDGDENSVINVDMGAIEFQGPLAAFGACCQPNGTCNVMVESECDGLNGIWRGPETNCSDFNANGIPDTCETIPVIAVH